MEMSSTAWYEMGYVRMYNEKSHHENTCPL